MCADRGQPCSSRNNVAEDQHGRDAAGQQLDIPRARYVAQLRYPGDDCATRRVAVFVREQIMANELKSGQGTSGRVELLVRSPCLAFRVGKQESNKKEGSKKEGSRMGGV